jgi:polar amino acid transport system substrate-binding protein
MKLIGCLVFVVILGITSIQAKDNIKISAPPSIWAQKQGETLTGPIINVVNEIFSELNITITPVFLPWARAIDHLKSGELDMIVAIFYSEEMRSFMNFTIPYIEVPTVVFVPWGKSFSYTSLQDLEVRSGLMMKGDSISPAFKRHQSKLNLTEISQYKQILKMLGDHRADYAVAAKFGFLIEAKKLGYIKKFEMLPVPIASRSL